MPRKQMTHTREAEAIWMKRCRSIRVLLCWIAMATTCEKDLSESPEISPLHLSSMSKKSLADASVMGNPS